MKTDLKFLWILMILGLVLCLFPLCSWGGGVNERMSMMHPKIFPYERRIDAGREEGAPTRI